MALYHRTAILCLLVFVGSGSADARRYDFQRKTLENGLTVITLEDHSCPVVAVQVWYGVGSKDEDPNRQGFAHMFEHMMFRGTDRLGPEAHFEYIRRTGGDCNAFTSFDNTTYVNKLPSNQLELALWLEAERMAALRVDEESFHKERAVVEEERRLRSLNTPYGQVPERLLPHLFKEHPYRWTPIGQIPHLRAATIEELQAFWDRYYVPANATLVIVGDVRHSDAQRLADKYFGWIPKMPAPPRVSIREPQPTQPQSITIPEKKGPVPIVGLVYRGVPQGHPDQIPLEMLMSIVGGGESSRIYKDVVKEQKIAQVAVAGAFSLQDDGIIGAGAVLMPWGDKQRTLDVIRSHLIRVREEPVTERELEKARNQFLSAEVRDSLTVVSKANLLGQTQVIEGDAEHANRRLDRIRTVTAADLQRVAKTYLDPQKETTGTVQPQVGGLLKSLFGTKSDDVDEGAAPVPKPTENRVAARGGLRADLKRPESFPEKPPVAPLMETFPEIEHVESSLANGLRVVVIPNSEVPFVTMTLGISYGAWTETRPGTASLAAAMITKGSEHHTAAELAEELEFHAISLGASATLDMATVFSSCVSDKFDRALRLLGEVVQTPKFPEDELDILRQQTLMGLMIQSKTPEYQADRELRRRLFGEHPYSRTATGEVADVQARKAGELREWWSSYVVPETSILYIAGDVTSAAAMEQAKAVFEEWRPSPPRPVVSSRMPPAPSATRVYLVDRPGSVQSQIRVGHLGITREHPDYFNALVLSQIFGGAFNSRLNKAIRVDKGLTYGARGGFRADRFAGTFTISTFTKTPATAETLQIILNEIDRITAGPPEPEELAQARSYMIGSFAGDRETPSATVNDLWLIHYARLPHDYFRRYFNGVRQATEESVQLAAKSLIRKDQLAIVVVGEAESIRSDLEKIAPVTLVKADTDEDMATPKQPIPNEPSRR